MRKEGQVECRLEPFRIRPQTGCRMEGDVGCGCCDTLALFWPCGKRWLSSHGVRMLRRRWRAASVLVTVVLMLRSSYSSLALSGHETAHSHSSQSLHTSILHQITCFYFLRAISPISRSLHYTVKCCNHIVSSLDPLLYIVLSTLFLNIITL